MGVILADEIAAALEAQEELRTVALDIRGAFDHVWWRGLLAHLHIIGIRGKTFALLKSYLSDRSFVVVTNGRESQFIRKLPDEARHAAILYYANDITLVMRIPTGERETNAALLTSDIECILSYGKKMAP